MKSRPRIIRPAAVPIGEPVNELECYRIKGNRKMAYYHMGGAF